MGVKIRMAHSEKYFLSTLCAMLSALIRSPLPFIPSRQGRGKGLSWTEGLPANGFAFRRGERGILLT